VFVAEFGSPSLSLCRSNLRLIADFDESHGKRSEVHARSGPERVFANGKPGFGQQCADVIDLL
jgi:hypothetical protein